MALKLIILVCPAEEAPVQAPEEEEAYEEGLLLGFDFGDVEHDLYFSNIKESLSGGNAGNIRYVEFQRVCLSPLPYLLHFQACRPIQHSQQVQHSLTMHAAMQAGSMMCTCHSTCST